MSGPLLLVSVRDAAEAAAAVAGGAAIVDVKDPARGPLGRAAVEVLTACVAEVPPSLPWTVAAGELRELSKRDAERLGSDLAGCPRPPAAVKFGLSGTAGWDWSPALDRLAAMLPPGSVGVPVAYADASPAVAPPVLEVIETAARSGFPLVLIDTFDKAGGGLLDLVPLADIGRWVDSARAGDISLLLAGRLRLAEIPLVAGCQPDAVAVRSAVCVGGRLGRIARRRVAIAADLCHRAACGRVDRQPRRAGVFPSSVRESTDEDIGGAGAARSGHRGGAAETRCGPGQGP